MLRPVQPDDAPALCAIYDHYVRHTAITFEEAPIPPEEMRSRISAVTQNLPWLVCEEDEKPAGYAYAGPWRPRSAYRFTVEVTVYLDPASIGRGLGSALLDALLGELRRREAHSVIGVIALPNDASVALFEKFGFQKVAHFREVGRKFDRWIDVGNWQLLLSAVARRDRK